MGPEPAPAAAGGGRRVGGRRGGRRVRLHPRGQRDRQHLRARAGRLLGHRQPAPARHLQGLGLAQAVRADRAERGRPQTPDAEGRLRREDPQGGQELTLQLAGTQLDADCAAAVWGQELVDLLAQGGCTQAARGIYTSSDGRYVAQYTLLNLRDSASADALVETLKTLLPGRLGPDPGGGQGGLPRRRLTPRAAATPWATTRAWSGYGRADGAEPGPRDDFLSLGLTLRGAEKAVFRRVVAADPARSGVLSPRRPVDPACVSGPSAAVVVVAGRRCSCGRGAVRPPRARPSSAASRPRPTTIPSPPAAASTRAADRRRDLPRRARRPRRGCAAVKGTETLADCAQALWGALEGRRGAPGAAGPYDRAAQIPGSSSFSTSPTGGPRTSW